VALAVSDMARSPSGPADILGQGLVGVRLASLMTVLRTLMRLPGRHIRTLLLLLDGCEISAGEIVELWSRVAGHALPVLQADETGWREDGEHGYIRSAWTPNGWRMLVPRPFHPQAKKEERDQFKQNIDHMIEGVIQTKDSKETGPVLVRAQDEACNIMERGVLCE